MKKGLYRGIRGGVKLLVGAPLVFEFASLYQSTFLKSSLTTLVNIREACHFRTSAIDLRDFCATSIA